MRPMSSFKFTLHDWIIFLQLEISFESFTCVDLTSLDINVLDGSFIDFYLFCEHQAFCDTSLFHFQLVTWQEFGICCKYRWRDAFFWGNKCIILYLENFGDLCFALRVEDFQKFILESVTAALCCIFLMHCNSYMLVVKGCFWRQVPSYNTSSSTVIIFSWICSTNWSSILVPKGVNFSFCYIWLQIW